MLQVCHIWRRLILDNRRSLPLIETHCHIYIMSEGDNDSQQKTSIRQFDCLVQYIFTPHNALIDGFEENQHRYFHSNNKLLRALHVSGHHGDLRGELEPNSQKFFHPIAIGAHLTRQCLSFMRIISTNFDVYMRHNGELIDESDERLATSYEFLNNNCGHVDIRSMTLRSQNSLFHWRLGQRSKCLLSALNSIRNIEVINVDDVNFLFGKNAMRLHMMRHVTLRMDASHMGSFENPLTIIVDGDIPLLERLVTNAKQRGFSLNAFTDQPLILLPITAEDILSFVQIWQSSLKPWLFHILSFNASLSMNEFRSYATRMGFFERRSIIALSHSRFQIFHKEENSVSMEICGKNRAVSTKWSLRICHNPHLAK
uniref:F-box domain-containing protein n=1 Tax=Parascaris univalens TaxID=6257 RepID=A0A915AL13_PARUN